MTRLENHRLLQALAINHDASTLAEDIIFCDQAQERYFYGREAVTALLDSFFIVTSIRLGLFMSHD